MTPDGWTRRVATAYWVLVGSLVAVILLAAVRALLDGWIPTGDNAFLAMRARAVFSANPPLLSTASSAGADASATYNHLGPMALYLAAPFTALFGSGWIVAGVALINSASVAGIGWIARRATRPALAAGVMAATAGLVGAMGSQILIDPWNPHVATLPFALAAVAAWGVWCRVAWAAPIGIAAGAIAGQTHLSFAAVSAVVGVALAAGVLRGALGADEPSERTRWIRSGLVSIGVGVLALAPTIIEQLRGGSDGNIARILRGTDLAAVTVGPEQTASVVASVLVRPPFFVHGSWGLPMYEADLLSPLQSLLALLVVTALAVAAVVTAWRRHDPAVSALVAIAALSIAVGSAMSLSYPLRLGVPIAYFRWLWPAAALLSVALVVPALEWFARRVVPEPARSGSEERTASTEPAASAGSAASGSSASELVAIGLLALGLVGALCTVPTANARYAGSSVAGQALTRDLFDQAEDRLSQLDRVEVIPSYQEGPLMSFTPALMDRLDELGVDVRSSDGVLVQQTGEQHRATGDEPWVLVMVGPDTSLDAGPVGGQRLGVHTDLSPERAQALEDDVAAAADQVRDAQVRLTDLGRSTGDEGLEYLVELADRPELFVRDRLLPEALRNGLIEITPPPGGEVDEEFLADVASRAFSADGRTFALWLVPRDEWESNQ